MPTTWNYLTITILFGCLIGCLQQAEASDGKQPPPEPTNTASEECDVITVPDYWATSQDSPRTASLLGNDFYVVSYLDRSEDLERQIPIFANIDSDGDSGRNEWSIPHSPIQYRDGLIALTARELNTNSDARLHLMVNSDPQWDEKAQVWDEVVNEVFSPGQASIATSLFSAGDFFLSLAFASALGDIVGPAQSASQALQALQQVSQGLQFTRAGVDLIESVSDIPGSDDQSLAPALHALAEIDEDLYDDFKQREHLSEQVNDFASAAGAGLDAASFLVSVAESGQKTYDAMQDADEHIRTLRVALSATEQATDGLLDDFTQDQLREMGVPEGGVHAFGIASDLAENTLTTVAFSETQQLVSRDISSTEEGFSDMVLTANVYATALQSYAEVLAESRQELLDPSNFDSGANYNNALAQYQYRVYKYFELHYTMARVLREYAELINTGVVGRLSVPSSAIEAFASQERELERLYRDIADELRAQSEVMDALLSGYPNYVGNCNGSSTSQSRQQLDDLIESMNGVWETSAHIAYREWTEGRDDIVYDEGYTKFTDDYISFYGSYSEDNRRDGYVCEQVNLDNIESLERRLADLENTLYFNSAESEPGYSYLSPDGNYMLEWAPEHHDFMKRYGPQRYLDYINETLRLRGEVDVETFQEYSSRKAEEMESYGLSQDRGTSIDLYERSNLPSWVQRECS